jgi:hypothetical protein
MSKNKIKTIEESRISLQKFELVYVTINKFIDMAKWVGIAYFSYKAIHDLAGKITLANINMSAIVNQSEKSGIPLNFYILISFFFIVAVISIWYGRREARLRKSTVEDLTKHIATLELIIDQKRTSSLLTARGDTAERDKR